MKVKIIMSLLILCVISSLGCTDDSFNINHKDGYIHNDTEGEYYAGNIYIDSDMSNEEIRTYLINLNDGIFKNYNVVTVFAFTNEKCSKYPWVDNTTIGYIAQLDKDKNNEENALLQYGKVKVLEAEELTRPEKHPESFPVSERAVAKYDFTPEISKNVGQYKAKDDFSFVTIIYKVKNDGYDIIPIEPNFWKLHYNGLNFDCNYTRGTESGTVNYGKTFDGEIIFEVPDNIGKIELVYDHWDTNIKMERDESLIAD